MRLILSKVLIFLGGGLTFKLIDYLIEWAKERREQRREKTAHEKDRPRIRVDISKGETAYPHIPALIVEILSLGGLPLTINDGEIFIEAGHYPEHVEPHQLGGREISPVAPIKFKFALPDKLINPLGIGKPTIKLVCHFSYGKDNERYSYEKTYNHAYGWFE